MTTTYAKQPLRFTFKAVIDTNHGGRVIAGKALTREAALKTMRREVNQFSGKLGKLSGYKWVKVISEEVHEI